MRVGGVELAVVQIDSAIAFGICRGHDGAAVFLPAAVINRGGVGNALQIARELAVGAAVLAENAAVIFLGTGEAVDVAAHLGHGRARETAQALLRALLPHIDVRVGGVELAVVQIDGAGAGRLSGGCGLRRGRRLRGSGGLGGRRRLLFDLLHLARLVARDLQLNDERLNIGRVLDINITVRIGVCRNQRVAFQAGNLCTVSLNVGDVTDCHLAVEVRVADEHPSAVRRLRVCRVGRIGRIRRLGRLGGLGSFRDDFLPSAVPQCVGIGNILQIARKLAAAVAEDAAVVFRVAGELVDALAHFGSLCHIGSGPNIEIVLGSLHPNIAFGVACLDLVGVEIDGALGAGCGRLDLFALINLPCGFVDQEHVVAADCQTLLLGARVLGVAAVENNKSVLGQLVGNLVDIQTRFAVRLHPLTRPNAVFELGGGGVVVNIGVDAAPIVGGVVKVNAGDRVGVFLFIGIGALGGILGVACGHAHLKGGADLNALTNREGLAVDDTEGCAARNADHRIVCAAQAYAESLGVIERCLALERHMDAGLGTREQDNALCARVEGDLAVLHHSGGTVVFVGDGLARRKHGADVDRDLGILGSADAADNCVGHIVVLIGSGEGVAR